MSNASEAVALSDEEFAALLALDSSMRQPRPAPAIELRLRHLGLIEPFRLSRMPIRTAKGEALILATLGSPAEDRIERCAYVLPEYAA